jgi:hypothetical protein
LVRAEQLPVTRPGRGRTCARLRSPRTPRTSTTKSAPSRAAGRPGAPARGDGLHGHHTAPVRTTRLLPWKGLTACRSAGHSPVSPRPSAPWVARSPWSRARASACAAGRGTSTPTSRTACSSATPACCRGGSYWSTTPRRSRWPRWRPSPSPPRSWPGLSRGPGGRTAPCLCCGTATWVLVAIGERRKKP